MCTQFDFVNSVGFELVQLVAGVLDRLLDLLAALVVPPFPVHLLDLEATRSEGPTDGVGVLTMQYLIR